MRKIFIIIICILALEVYAFGKVHKYIFTVSIGKWNILPDIKVKSLMINNKIPCPNIEVGSMSIYWTV